MEARLASQTDWYHPNLLEDEGGGGVGKDEGKEGLEAHSWMSEEGPGCMDGNDEQSAFGVV